MAYPALVQALQRPEAYRPEERPRSIELVETHISYLFLTGTYVYKVKKPMDFGFLDFTTLAKRLWRQGLPSDGRWEIFHQQQAAFQPLTELQEEELLRVDTSRSRGETLAQALRGVYTRLLARRSGEVRTGRSGPPVSQERRIA